MKTKWRASAYAGAVTARGPKTSDRLRVRRVYDEPDAADGLRVLVDRLWPRGLSKEAARVDLWAKALAPSDALRRAVHSDPTYPDDPARWRAFLTAYRAELEQLSDPAAVDAQTRIKAGLEAGTVTLLYASTRVDRNHAAALRDWLLARS